MILGFLVGCAACIRGEENCASDATKRQHVAKTGNVFLLACKQSALMKEDADDFIYFSLPKTTYRCVVSYLSSAKSARGFLDVSYCCFLLHGESLP